MPGFIAERKCSRVQGDGSRVPDWGAGGHAHAETKRADWRSAPCENTMRSALCQRGGGRGAVKAVPRLCGTEVIVHVLDVLHARVVEPVFQGAKALFAVDGDGVLPSGAAAENAGEVDAGLGSELERLGEHVVGHAGGKIDERALGDGGGAAEVVFGLIAGVGGLAL